MKFNIQSVFSEKPNYEPALNTHSNKWRNLIYLTLFLFAKNISGICGKEGDIKFSSGVKKTLFWSIYLQQLCVLRSDLIKEEHDEERSIYLVSVYNFNRRKGGIGAGIADQF